MVNHVTISLVSGSLVDYFRYLLKGSFFLRARNLEPRHTHTPSSCHIGFYIPTRLVNTRVGRGPRRWCESRRSRAALSRSPNLFPNGTRHGTPERHLQGTTRHSRSWRTEIVTWYVWYTSFCSQRKDEDCTRLRSQDLPLWVLGLKGCRRGSEECRGPRRPVHGSRRCVVLFSGAPRTIRDVNCVAPHRITRDGRKGRRVWASSLST